MNKGRNNAMICEFCREIGFTQEAENVFADAFDKLKSDDELFGKVCGAMDEYFMKETLFYENVLNEVSKKLGISIYTINMVFLIMCAKPLRYMFYIKGYSDELYLNTMKDMIYKADECRKLYGVWGTFVLDWYRFFCKCNVFALGRLQFQEISSPVDYKDIVKKGDRIIATHIPSGSPLKIEDVHKSFDEAYKFFGGNGEKMVFSCHSWLLYPPQYEMYAEGSNLRKFYDIWDITNVEESNGNFWRVFYKPEGYDLSKIVPETSLAKKLLEYLKSGGSMGFSRGIYVYSPSK